MIALLFQYGILAAVPKSARLIFTLLILLGLTVRVGLALHQSTNLNSLPDQKEYLSIAQNLRAHHSLSFFDARFGQEVYAYRLPGYPLLLALSPSVLTIRLTQILIDLSTIYAVFLTARHLSGNVATALTAAGLMALNPFYVYFTSLVLSETLFAALLAWAILFLVRKFHWLGLMFLIASCYVRSTGLLLVPAVVLIASLNNPAPAAYRFRRALLQSILACVFLCLSLIPWATRNHHLLGSTVWSTTNSGMTLYDGFHSGATGASDQRFIVDLGHLRSMNELQRSDYLTQQAKHWMVEHSLQIPALEARKILRGWSPIPLSRDFGSTTYRLISVSYVLPFDILCVVGLFSRQLNRWAKMLMLTPAMMMTLAQAITVGSIRYRMPAEASLAILAATGFVDLCRHLRKKDKTPLVISKA